MQSRLLILAIGNLSLITIRLTLFSWNAKVDYVASAKPNVGFAASGQRSDAIAQTPSHERTSMHVSRRAATTIVIAALTIPFGTGAATAQTQPAEPRTAASSNVAHYAGEADADAAKSVDKETLAKLNEARASDGLPALPDDTTALELRENGTVAAQDSSGKAIDVEDESTDFQTPQKPGPQDAELRAAGGDSVIKNAAQAVAGCAGGVIGYDAILEILERRVSYWTFVKWLGGKIGWGLAVSCVSGGVSAAMGW